MDGCRGRAITMGKLQLVNSALYTVRIYPLIKN